MGINRMDETDDKKPHILVVDDLQEIRVMVTQCLEQSGYRVSSAQDSQDAYVLLACSEFDAILTDVMMPGEDGIEFLANIHLSMPGVPVIIMTGFAQLQMAVNAIKNGAFDFIHKPFDIEYLCNVIAKAVTYSKLLRMEKNYREELENTVLLRTAELKSALEQLDSAKSALLKSAGDKSAFLATITHEMRTPLNGVVGALDLLANEGLSGTQREFLELARHSACTMTELIDQVLSFGNGFGHGAVFGYDVIDLRKTIESLIEDYQPRFNGKRLDLVVNTTPAVPGHIRSNGEQLTRLLSILLGNALKFTDTGGVRLDISSESAENNREQMHFVVVDSGTGIPADMLERIFEPFVQADSSLTRRFGGVGLGLSIARQIALLLNGHIWAESTPGTGSSLHFCMPIDLP
jgi:signal transduction histidine kinase